MATYRLKRKSYGIVEGAENVVGGTMKGVGKAADTALGGVAGAAMGAKYLGEGIGAVTGLGGLGGALLGAGLGALVGLVRQADLWGSRLNVDDRLMKWIVQDLKEYYRKIKG